MLPASGCDPASTMVSYFSCTVDAFTAFVANGDLCRNSLMRDIVRDHEGVRECEDEAERAAHSLRLSDFMMFCETAVLLLENRPMTRPSLPLLK